MNTEEAKTALNQIKKSQRSSQAVGQREVSWFFIIWGLVWLIGFLISHLAPDLPLGWIWFVLCGLGGAVSGIVGMRLGQKVQHVQTGPTLSWFYPAAIGFGLLWLFLAEPVRWEQTAVLAITHLGFAVIVTGIIIKRNQLIQSGVGVTLMAVLIYFLALPLFGLIIGVLGGGGMLLIGLFMQRQRGEDGPA